MERLVGGAIQESRGGTRQAQAGSRRNPRPRRPEHFLARRMVGLEVAVASDRNLETGAPDGTRRGSWRAQSARWPTGVAAIRRSVRRRLEAGARRRRAAL